MPENDTITKDTQTSEKPGKARILPAYPGCLTT